MLAAGSANFHVHRNNLNSNRIAIAFGIVPARQIIETVVYHFQRVAQIFLAAAASGQVGEIGGNACVV